MSTANQGVVTTLTIIAFCILLIMVFAGPIARFGGMQPILGFKLGLYTSLVGLVLFAGLVVWVIFRGLQGDFSTAFLAYWKALLWAGIAGCFFLGLLIKAGSVPAIHNITTDPNDPPVFTTLINDREEGWNALAYPYEQNASVQAAAYPDLQPILSPLSPEKAYRKALTVALQLGWDIAQQSEQSLHIECSVTSLWFGFVDDVAIRIRPRQTGSQIDLISVSRVGKSDLGANANRIRQFRDVFQSDNSDS